MSNNLQLDDQKATLKLAKQIGLKPNCNPCIDLPNSIQKYSIAHWKFMIKYLHKYHTTVKKQESCKKYISNVGNKIGETEKNRLGVSLCTKRQISTNEGKRKQVQDQQQRIKTARTTFGRRTNHTFENSNIKRIINQSAISQQNNQNSQSKNIRQNKTLLFNMWKQHQLQNYAKRKIKQNQSYIFPLTNKPYQKRIINSDSRKKTKKDNLKQIGIKFNSTIKSFEFC